MLAGLLFATHDAEDRPGMLAATLAFGQHTLIEYQARLLMAEGAAQIVVVVSRLTPELLGAIARIGRAGIPVDTVRTAAEAAARFHPLARVVMLADSLVTTPAAVSLVAGEGRDLLIIAADGSDPAAGLERIDARAVWAGIARFDPARLGDVAGLPADYDLQSALIRALAQAGARQVPLAPAAAGGHGIERRGNALAARGREVVAAELAAAPGWFERWAVAPATGPLLWAMLERRLPTEGLAAGAAAIALVAAALLVGGIVAVGAVLALVATALAIAGGWLAKLRDEDALARALAAGAMAIPAVATLLIGRVSDAPAADVIATILAVVLVGLAALGERAAATRRRTWWGTPAAYLLIVVAGALAGAPTIAIALAAGYAGATLAAAIEALRGTAITRP